MTPRTIWQLIEAAARARDFGRVRELLAQLRAASKPPRVATYPRSGGKAA
jgi:hypothetical protein